MLPKQGKEEALNSASQIRSFPQLRETTVGARSDEVLYELLYELLCVREPRDLLRSVLIETYFPPEVKSLIIEQGTVNHEAFLYSEKLLKQRGKQIAEESLAEKEAYRPARDQGFRRAVVIAYVHRCALCGIRIRSMHGHTAEDAAHIIPWSVGRDDRPANGVALCRTCHWAFDEGLLGVSRKHEILDFGQLGFAANLPGYLTHLEGRDIVRPAEKAYWPDLKS